MKKIIFLVLVVVCADVWAMKLEIRSGYNREASEALFKAIDDDDVEVIKRAIEAGADVNAKNDDGRTPLHLAAYGNSKKIMDTLIAAGADVNAKDNHGDTPLYGAVRSNSKESMDALLAAGVDVNSRDNNGLTPLNLAVDYLLTKAMKKLIELGATIPYGLHDVDIKELDSVIEKINEERESYNDALRGLSALRGKSGRMNPFIFERLYAPQLPLASKVYAQRQSAEAI